MSETRMEADVAVVGAGAAGLAAALAAADEGATVILFEKQASVGGTSRFFVGTFAVESIMQQYDTPILGLYAAGIDVGGLHAESYSMTDTSGATSAFALNSGRMAGENAARYLRSDVGRR